MKEVIVPTADGKSTLRFNLHKFSPLDGRKILACYPLAVLNKEHTYQSNEAAMRKLMAYCSVTVGDDEVHLTSDELINEHVPDWWTLVQLEFACLKHNCTFLENAGLVDVVKSSAVSMLRQLVAEQIQRVNGEG